MDVNQVRFGEYSIGNPRTGVKKGDDKANDNKEFSAPLENNNTLNPENVLNAMNLAGMQNKAQINITQREINPSDFLSEERISDIEAMMAGFENGVNQVANVIDAEFPGTFTQAQKNSLAAAIFAKE